MKVFNLTDVETRSLRQHKLLKQSVLVAGKLIAPGESVELTEPVAGHDHTAMKHPLSVQALAVDSLPDGYLKAGSKSATPAPVAIAPEFPPPVSKRSKLA
jgi:hypothetical protein